ncbi:MAG: CoA pyrophosphatase [Labilithrix sp.]|nr:CoA pyrophosphatase [Labilithrix sp.]
MLAKLGEARPDAASAEAAEGSPQAAVAAILRQPSNADSAELFFIQRAEDPKDPWSGHIAFPGGRRDPGDASLLHTAIRETREEVGLDLGPGDLVARLPDVPAFIRSKRGVLVVSPFVFVMRSDVAPTLNREVATTLWVPMATFARGEGRGTYAFTWEDRPYELPCFRLEPGQKVLWGMTYRMVETMLEAIGLARVG